MLAALAVLATVPSQARAGDASRYTLQLTGERVRFTATLNGLPIGPSGNPAESLAYSVDAFMHNGVNHLKVAIDRDGAYGAAGVLLLGPATGAFGSGESPQLAMFACNPVAGDGIPACNPHELIEADVERTDVSDLRLWHASPPLGDRKPDVEIAAALAALTRELLAAAQSHDWSRLYYLTDVRKVDMQRANPDVGKDEAAAAAGMRTMLTGNPTAMPPPGADRLTVTALPGSLWSVQRTDGLPLLRIDLAHPAIKGEPDPEAYGDFPERWGRGIVLVRVAVFGIFDGRWQLVR